MASKDNKPRTYSLTPIETQLIQTIVDQQATMLSNTLSFIAISRLNLVVTGNTKFVINEDMTEITVNQEEDSDNAK